MRVDERLVYERPKRGAVQGAPPLPPSVASTISGGCCPPVIEEWLRESRARLLRRYGGIAGRPSTGRRTGE